MVAGIVLVALGMKKTLGHVEDPLKLVPAAALLGGTAIYLLAHVAFRYRHVHTLNTRRLGARGPARRVHPGRRRDPGARDDRDRSPPRSSLLIVDRDAQLRRGARRACATSVRHEEAEA